MWMINGMFVELYQILRRGLGTRKKLKPPPILLKPGKIIHTPVRPLVSFLTIHRLLLN